MTENTVLCLLLLVLGNASAYRTRGDNWMAAIAGEEFGAAASIILFI